MKNKSYMPKSKSNVHITPQKVYDKIGIVWNISKEEMHDPCPVGVPYKSACFFNGLYGDWKKINYVNPPYEKLSEFVSKAIKETKKGYTSIMLLPSKTDQMWFHQVYFLYGRQIIWFRKRLKFENAKHHATQPHFLVMIK